MNIDAVLLEFEGVVADTAYVRRAAITNAFAEAGVQLSEADYYNLCAGWPTWNAVRAVAIEQELALDDTVLDLIANAADRAYSAHVGKGVVLVDGARTALERLASRSRLGIVSRLRRNDLDVLISLGKLEHLFAFVIGAEDAAPGKPEPFPYQRALERLARLAPGTSGKSRVVALEDGVAGIRSAHRAGIECIVVGGVPPHVAMEADAWIESLTGLDPGTLDSLLSEHGERSH